MHDSKQRKQSDELSFAGKVIEAGRQAAARVRSKASIAERHRRHAIIQHPLPRSRVRVSAEIVPDKHPGADDVIIAKRLLRAYRAAEDTVVGTPKAHDLWSLIAGQQETFASLLNSDDADALAAYLCNVCRHDASIGISQGDHEYRRLVRDRAYRKFVALMTKDKLISLAEAVGALPVENPEQGVYGQALTTSVDDVIECIASTLGHSIEPPDIDGGLFKLRTRSGLFGERDANAIFTAWLVARASRDTQLRRFCEIGGGSGRVAYWSHRFGVAPYTIVDLPHVNVVQGYYLLKALPADHVRLYGEAAHEMPPPLTIWPNHAIGELREVDVVLNQDSMPEMSRATVDEYLAWIAQACRGEFISINHENKPPYGRNQTHVSVHEATTAAGTFVLNERYPYWLRNGYVVEKYSCPGASGTKS